MTFWRYATRAVLLALPVLACGANNRVTGVEPRDGRAILFIGNSLTYVNAVPLIVEALADSAGGQRLAVADVTAPDYALEDHWREGDAQRAIARGGWSVVVLQQGPSSVAENRANLRQYAARFDAEAKKVGARSGLYSVWPQLSRQADFPAAAESYRLAAADVGGLYFPVADAWRAAWRRDANMPLYSGDGLHASVRGSYLAALVIYGVLEQRRTAGLPARLALRSGAVIQIPAADAAILQAAADEVTAIK
jgi:hypothetical protein